jgi:proteasome lid subunit RPN8/RPN11
MELSDEPDDSFFEIAAQVAKKETGNDVFRCPSDLTGCPVAKKTKVYIPYGMFSKWIFFAQSIQTEWLAYLKGDELEDGSYQITEMYFPPQRATGAHCEAEDGHIQPGTIGAVHSHVNMGVFFSAEDIAHMNHPVELVVNAKGEIKANSRTVLECGRAHRGDAEVLFTDCDDMLSELEELNECILPSLSTFTTARPKGERSLSLEAREANRNLFFTHHM